ncbi:MAG: hypothetical protein JRD88_08205 [Deltaproteobacteria bacterium]|nr:hypothetical protein [Deltaproteobacteria bacterium]
MKSFSDIDDDSVHTTTASCHHGARLPEPVMVELRAFYTDQFLFLRMTWEDATRDDRMLDWVYSGGRWQNTGQFEDGFGLLWDAQGAFERFSCSYACHINDFGVNQSSFHATNKMRLAKEETWLDLWNWKASRTARYNFADDRYLDHNGMHGDTPDEIFVANSKASQDPGSRLTPFGEVDQPLYDAERQPVSELNPTPGTRLPGYLVEPPLAGRNDVNAVALHLGGRWQVTLRRALNTNDPRDVVFIPGDMQGVAFGLAMMDHTLYEHYASKTEERLLLLPPQLTDEEVGKSYGMFGY